MFVFPLALHLVTLLFVVVKADIFLRFNGASDFYHELGEDAMIFLFGAVSINPKTVKILGRLLADDRVDIQKYYNESCKLMSRDRAISLLSLIDTRKDLEMYLLGPTCLSQTIIDARKSFLHMWPPSGFPLLVYGFMPEGLATNDIQDILKEALNKPEWWQTPSWTTVVGWKKMTDSSFWRMIPPSWYAHIRGLSSYLRRALLQNIDQATFQNLEELFMKAIRIPDIDDKWKRALNQMGLDESSLLDRFSHLEDPWSIKVVQMLKRMYSKGWKRKQLSDDLLNSELLNIAFWNDGPIDKTTTTNDIFELFTVALEIAKMNDQTEEIIQPLMSFFDDIPDWSIVRPLVLDRAILTISEAIGDPFLESYVDKMLENSNAFAVLPEWLRTFSRDLKVHKYNVKISSRPLKGRFLMKEQDPDYPIDLYTNMLYQEWIRDKANWSGFAAAHDRMDGHVKGVFKSSQSGDDTYDPKTNEQYAKNSWHLAFASIKFEISHDIPSRLIPSKCFLLALLYLSRVKFLNWSWAHIKRVAGWCIFPERQQEQAQYQDALGSAQFWFVRQSPPLPIDNVELLYALIKDTHRETSMIP